MAINDIVQTIAEARVDARSLSEFVFKPASFIVTRRLAPSVRTLQYYVDRFETIDSSFTQALNTANAAAVTATNNAVGLIDNVTNNAYQQVSSAIDGIAIDANLVTDALVTTSIRRPGQVVRTQADKNEDVINVDDFIDKNDFSLKVTGEDGKQYIDYYAAILAAEASVRIDHQAIQRIGATIRFKAGTYYISETLNLKSTTRLIGEAGGTSLIGATILLFAKGKDGIIVNRHNTNGAMGTVVQTKAADGATLSGLELRQDGYIRTSSAVIDYNPAHGLILANEHGGLAAGTTVHCYDDRLRVKMSAKIVSDTGTNAGLRAIEPSRHIDVPLGTVVTGSISGATGSIEYVGCSTLGYVIRVASGSFVAGDVITYGAQQFTIKYVNPYRLFRVYSLSDVVGGLTGVDKVGYGDVLCDSTHYGTGIRLRGRASIHQCIIRNFPHFGLLNGTDGNLVGNANCMDVNILRIENIGIHGFFTLGGDSNAGTVVGLNVVGCTGYGVRDHSFLGNHYLSAHTSLHGIGHYYSSEYNNKSVFIGCYSEGGAQLQPFPSSTSRIGKDSAVIGGVIGAGMESSGSGYNYLGSGDFRVADALFLTKATAANGLLEESSFCLRATGADPRPLTLIGVGNAATDRGVNLDFRLQANTRERDAKDELKNSIKAGSIGVVFNGTLGSHFVVDVKPTPPYFNQIRVIGGTPTKAAVLSAVVAGGLVTDIIVHYGGEGYKSTPILEGLGGYIGLELAANMFNGSVQSVTIMQNIIGATNTKPIKAFEVTDNAILGNTSGTSALGAPRRCFSKSYSVLGGLTVSTDSEQSNQLFISPALLDAWADVSTTSYQMLSEVNTVGSANAVTHYGFNAKSIYNLLYLKGFDALKLGIVERLKWRENQVDYERWFVRAEQCLVIEAAYQRRENSRIIERLELLEAK